MKRLLLRFLMAAGLVILVLGPLGIDVAYADYRVSRYVVTFEVVPNRRGELCDVRVTLEVTYDVRDETKSSGSKFVGTTQIEDVSVTDGEGQPLEFKVKHLEEEQIEWSFPAVRDGQQTVIAQFTIPDALQGNKKRNTFRADWSKNWKVEVSNVTYRFIFPEDFDYKYIDIPSMGYHERAMNGRRIIEVSMDELWATPFRVTFSPGLVEREAPSRVTNKSSSSTNRSSSSDWENWLCVAFLPLALLGLFVFNKLTKGNWTSSRSGSGGGGCGGGGCGDGCGGCGGCGE